MADMSKAEKRAVALKKLKEFQQQKTTTNTIKTAKKKQGCPGQVGKSDGSESFSYFTGFANSSKTEIKSQNGTSTLQETVLQPMHDKNLNDDSNNKNNGTQNNFDNVEETEENGKLHPIMQTSIKQDSASVSNIFSSNFPPGGSNYSDFFDSLAISSNVPQNDLDTINFPSSEQSEIKDQILDQTVLSTADGNPPLHETLQSSVENVDLYSSGRDRSEMKTDFVEKSHNNDISANGSIPSTVEDINKMSIMSSTESLRQLSLEMNGLVEESAFTAEQHKVDGQHKYQELVELLAREQQRSENLQLSLKEHELCAVQLRAELAQQRLELEGRQQRELGVLQEQLQLHTQALGNLVAQKTELEAALDTSQQEAKHRAAELEEVQGRLRAARQRASDLEREVAAATGSSRQLEGAAAEQGREVARLRLEKQMLAKQLEEVEEEAGELRSSLGARSAELLQLQAQAQEQRAQLDLAQLRVQQLSLADGPDAEQQLGAAHQQRLALELQVAELQGAVRSLSQERDQANGQYQEYLQHVSGQLSTMADKLATATSENERLTQREQSLVQHLSDLEKQLQQQRAQRDQEHEQRESRAQADKRVAQLWATDLEQQLSSAQEEVQALTQRLGDAQQELGESRELAQQLQGQLDALQADCPDADRLLAAMESDKVAAARAVGQNLQLKKQLEELQEGFVQMSNSKLELTEQLQKEQHLSKELGERLAQQEMELGELRLQLQQSQQEAREQEARHTLQQSQLADQVRHYGAQGHMAEMLQRQLREAQEESDALRSQLEDERQRQPTDAARAAGPVVDAGTATVDEDQSRQDDEKKYVDMQEAMERLQARFSTTMAEVAELSDEKQRLEHLVLQLQEETETIGEYIALYQVQRSILRQRAQEKDEQLARLAHDREEVKTKLSELNRLINLLMAEKEDHISPGVDRKALSDTHLAEAPEGLANGDVSSTLIPIKTSAENEDFGSTLPVSDMKEEFLAGSKVDTAGKIIALLSEIETSTLVEPRNNENFHPCPWCSGRLITV